MNIRLVGIVLLAAFFVSLAAAHAPLYGAGQSDTIQDEYIVVLADGASVQTRDLHVSVLSDAIPTVKVMRKYAIGGFIAFAAVLDKSALALELEHPDVKYIEANRAVRISEGFQTQLNATWGLDRIDQRSLLPLPGTYRYFDNQGAGVDAYVLDTGIRHTHDEFEGRAIPGANFIPSEPNTVDGNGHGTHVAGTIGGKTYGVAKKVTLIAVKVLSNVGGGTLEGVIAGVEYVAAEHLLRGRKSVANMSLVSLTSLAVNAAVDAAMHQGVTFVVAAGNNNADACEYSPAGSSPAITVGATDYADMRAYFSNFGSCLDIFAPGVDIMSAWIGSNTATSIMSGTSMASPHVAGAVALLLAHDPVHRSPANVSALLIAYATANKITSPGTNSPNKLLYSPYTDSVPVQI